MKATTIVVLFSLAFVCLTNAAHADCDGSNCCVCGQKICVLKVTEGKEEVVGFEVKPKEICIPGIRFPWDKCGTRRCGTVRTICVLEEAKKEKTVCEYEWSIKTICTQCCKAHGLRQANHAAEIVTDRRVPFEYRTADRVVDANPSADLPISKPARLAGVLPITTQPTVGASFSAPLQQTMTVQSTCETIRITDELSLPK